MADRRTRAELVATTLDRMAAQRGRPMRPAKTERDLWDNRTNVDPWTQSAALFLQQPVGWQDKAACAGMSQRLFFPGKERGAADAAKAICALCPVSADCLDYARTTRAADGIWGGVRFSRGKEIA